VSYIQSPLRYPGGKSGLSGLLAQFIELNNLQDGIYIEPYAGGAGAGLKLLFSEYVSELILNDADRNIYLFWRSILFDTERFIKLLNDTPISIDEWEKRRQILKNSEVHSELEIAFSTFYLNRCNRSGILYAGPIGGQLQSGKWLLDARFNKVELTRRIEKIALFASRISIHNLDAIDFIKQHALPLAVLDNRLLVYLDPPYYSKGSQLYLNYYVAENHVTLANFINNQLGFKWIVSYDDVPQIRQLYSERRITTYSPRYSAHSAKIGKEVIIYCPNCLLPKFEPEISN
jgi:DNA adenine methylase